MTSKSLKRNTSYDFSEKVLITRLTTQKWLDVGPDWTVDEYKSAHSQMKYEYRVTCAAHYYGKGCEDLCRPRDDNFGHYSCSPSGERVCLTGWKGDYCNLRKYTIFIILAFMTASYFSVTHWPLFISAFSITTARAHQITSYLFLV